MQALGLTLSWPKGIGPRAGLQGDIRSKVFDPEGLWLQKLMGFEVKTVREAVTEYKRWLQWSKGKGNDGSSAPRVG